MTDRRLTMLPALAALTFAVLLPAQARPHHQHAADDNATVQNATCDNAKFATDQKRFASGELRADIPETVCGTVGQVLPSKTTRSGLHGYFYLTLSGQPGGSIEIVSDLDEMQAPAWPWVKSGDQVQVTGRYYYDSASRQGIDWTHHGSSRKWPYPGSVTVDGTVYQ